MSSLICAWINGWVNNREAGDLRRQRAHYDVIVMVLLCFVLLWLYHLGWSAVSGLYQVKVWLNTSQRMSKFNLWFSSEIGLESHTAAFHSWGPFYLHGLTLIPTWIINHIYYNAWDEITYWFPNFSGATVEVLKWISSFIPHFTRHVITYPCWYQTYSMCPFNSQWSYTAHLSMFSRDAL